MWSYGRQKLSFFDANSVNITMWKTLWKVCKTLWRQEKTKVVKPLCIMPQLSQICPNRALGSQGKQGWRQDLPE